MTHIQQFTPPPHTHTHTHTNVVPGPVVDLTCSTISSSTDTLNIIWSPPTDSEDTVISYQVKVRRYVSSEEREVTTNELSEPFNKEVMSSNTLVPELGEL